MGEKQTVVQYGRGKGLEKKSERQIVADTCWLNQNHGLNEKRQMEPV